MQRTFVRLSYYFLDITLQSFFCLVTSEGVNHYILKLLVGFSSAF